MEKNTIGIILGSTREKRFGEYPATWLMELGAKHETLAFELIDLRDYPLPFHQGESNPSYMNGIYADPAIATWAAKMSSLDGYIVITPEYNHSFSAVLKNAFDHIYGEFVNKPVALVSYGSVGGARAVEQFRLVAIEHQMAPLRNAVHIMAPWLLREEDGSLKAGALDTYAGAADSMLAQLSWWTSALKTARQAVQFSQAHVATKSA